MASSAAEGWRLAGPTEDDVDAVEAALGSEAATLTYGHHSFEFAKLPAADGGWSCASAIAPRMFSTNYARGNFS